MSKRSSSFQGKVPTVYWESWTVSESSLQRNQCSGRGRTRLRRSQHSLGGEGRKMMGPQVSAPRLEDGGANQGKKMNSFWGSFRLTAMAVGHQVMSK